MVKPEIGSERVDGREIRFLEYKGNGPTVVLLHATGFLPWLWDPIARELAPEYRVLAPYFCDHRKADPDKGGLSWMVLAEDLAGLLSALDIQAPLLAGHSMGGAILTLAAAACGVSPAAMVLIEPIFLPREVYGMEITVENHPLASKSIRRRNHWKDREEALGYLREKPLFASWDPEMLDLYVAHGLAPDENGGLSLTCSPRREAALFMGSVSRDPWPLIPEIFCPVLILEGETSENRKFIDYPAIAKKFPEGSYRMLADTGHLVPMERPVETLAILRECFSAAEKAAP